MKNLGGYILMTVKEYKVSSHWDEWFGQEMPLPEEYRKTINRWRARAEIDIGDAYFIDLIYEEFRWLI